MERLSDRIGALEAYIKVLGEAEELKDRVATLENNIYTTKRVLTFTEACLYMGVSESLLYKLTATHEVPHFKPRGKMIYFDKQELDHWLLQNGVAVAVPQEEMEVEPTKEKRRYARRKKSNS